jgi:hypothetical protein
MQAPLTLRGKHLVGLVTTTNKNHEPFQSIELGDVFIQVAIRVPPHSSEVLEVYIKKIMGLMEQ